MPKTMLIMKMHMDLHCNVLYLLSFLFCYLFKRKKVSEMALELENPIDVYIVKIFFPHFPQDISFFKI